MAKYLFNGKDLNTRTTSSMATQWPLFGKGHPVRFWAEKGLIKWRDETPGLPPGKQYGVMLWQKAAKHVIGISEMVINSSEDRKWAHERRVLQQFISEMEAVIREAKEQGGPLDGGSVARDYVRRRPKSVIMPQVVDLDI